MKAIVTGGTGFVGSNLCRSLLKKGWDVAIISQKEFGYNSIIDIKDKITVYEYDELTNLIGFFKEFKADVVFHLASLFIAEHKVEEIDSLVESNLKFGLYIMEAMKESSTKLIVNTGTSWQHFHSNDYNPVCLYAATKEAFENLMKYYIEAENIRAVTLKLFDTYGENDTRPKLINLLNKFAREKTELKMSAGEQMLDLVHVDDVIEAFLSAYEYLNGNETIRNMSFGISSGSEIKLKDVINLYEKITGNKLNVLWGEREYRKREVMKLWRDFDVLPNWECKISLEEGLKKYSE